MSVIASTNTSQSVEFICDKKSSFLASIESISKVNTCPIPTLFPLISNSLKSILTISSILNSSKDVPALNISIAQLSISTFAILLNSSQANLSISVVVGDLNNNVSDNIADNKRPAIS